jgi:ribosomal protein L30E
MNNTTIDELKKLTEQKRTIFGSTEVIKRLKQNKIQKVVIASNIPSGIEEDIKYNASLNSVDVEKIDLPNDELSMVFKRTHPLLAVGVLKE